MNRFRFGPEVQADLQEIRNYFEREGRPDGALRLMREFRDAFRLLGENPGGGARRAEWGEHIRSWPVRSYLVIYDTTRLPVEILRVVSGYRDLARIELE